MAQLISNVFAAWPMVVRRSLSHWRLLSTVIVGVLLASTIMAGTVIYFEALRQLALKNALNQLTVEEKNILIKADRGPTTVEEYVKVRNLMEGQFQRRLGWMLRDSTRGGRSATFFITTPGNESVAGDDNSRTYFVFSPPLLEHITILPGGRLPNEQALNNPNVPLELEVLVPREPGQILVSEATLVEVRALVQATRVENIELQGVGRPTQIYEIGADAGLSD